MSHNLPQTSSSANYQAIFDNALKVYEKKTGNVLASDPLLRSLESCNSPDAVLVVLREQVPGFEQPGSEFTSWVKPTINVLYNFSSTIGGAVTLAYPPAGVIVTGIANLLSAVQGVSASQDALLDIFERIENVFRRMETYTELCPTKEMTDIMIKVMVEVLLILALVTKEIKQGKLKKFLKKVAGRSEIDDALRRLDKLTQEEHRMATAQALRATHGVRDDAKHIKGELNDQKWDQQQNDLATWLSPPDPFINYNTASDARCGGTGVWFTESSEFKDWKESASLLWVYGKPGAGKSVITSAIIKDIKDISDTGPAYMAFFFFDFKDTAKQDSRALLSSVIVQLSRRSQCFYDILFNFYSVHQKGLQQPSISALTKCLEDMIKASGDVPIYLVLDAVDECPNTKGIPSSRRQVLDLVEKLVNQGPPQLHVCITSRPEVDIRTSLEPLTSESNRICLHDQIGQKKDIVEFVRAVVYSDSNMQRWRDEDKQLVIEMLSEKANGMFRWVFCQLDVLRQCFPSSVRGVLADLPESLDETYERILQQIPKPNRVHAHRLLQCLVVAAYPLNVEDLAEVLAVGFSATGMTPILDENLQWEDKERAVLSACSSLITIVQDYDSRLVHFSHFSVKEFLTSDRLAASTVDPLRYHHIALEPAQMVMTISCLRIMQQGLKFNICGLKSSYKMNYQVVDISALVDKCIPSYLAYACQYWADHLHGIATAEKRDTDIVNLLRNLLNFHLLYWLEALSLLSRSRIASKSLLIAAEWLEATDKDLSLTASDARQFCLTFAYVISASAPHIYLSALPFAPPSSLVSKRYRVQFPRTIKVLHEEGTKWPAIPSSISLDDRVFDLSVHPDGKRVAAATSGSTAVVISVTTGGTLFELAGHGGSVRTIAYAANGKRIATGCDDGCLRIFEAKNGLLLFGPFELHSRWIQSLSWSPDGQRIVTGSADRKVKVLAAETGQVIYDTAFHDDWVCTVVFTSEFFISGSDDRTVRIYDASTGTASGEAWSTGQTGYIRAIAVSPDNKILAAGGNDHSVILYNMDTRSVINQPMRGHGGAITSLALSKDGQLLASGSADATVRLWNVRTGKMFCDPLYGHTYSVSSVRFSPDMKQLITGGEDFSIRFFDIDSLPVRKNSSGATGTFRAAIPLDDGKTILASDGSSISRWTVDAGRVEDVTFEGNSEHLEGIQSVSISPNGRFVATAASNRMVMIWLADSGKTLWGPLEGHGDDIYALSFSADSKMVVSGSDDRNVRIWSAETGQSICGPMKGHTSSVKSVCFSPDGKQVASGSNDYNAIVWSVESGEKVHEPLVHHGDLIFSVAYSPNGLYLATASDDCTVAIWDVATGERVFNTLTDHGRSVRLVNWSPDSKRIVTAALDNEIHVFDVETGIPLCEPLIAHKSNLTAISMRPSLYSVDPEVVSASLDGTVRVWVLRMKNFVNTQTFSGDHSDFIRTIAFSPVDDRIASGGDDGRLVVMDVVTGQSTVNIRAHKDRIRCMAYSPDGKKIATCSDDYIISIWGAENGERLLEPLEGHTDVVMSIEFSPGGRFLVSGSADGTIRTWDLHPSFMKLNPIGTCRGHKSTVNAVAYASGGELIVSGSADAEIAVWEGSLSDKCLRQFGGHGGAVLSIRVFDDKIFSSSEDRTIRIWELSTGHVLKSILSGHTGPINAIALTPDGGRIVSASDDSSLRIFDSETGEPCTLPLRMSERMFAVAVSHDGAQVACSGAYMWTHVWRGNMARRDVWPDDFIRKARGLEFCLVDEHGFLADFNPPGADGWLCGSTNVSMCWIPPAYRAGLWTPRTVGILGALETIIDLRSFVHGTDWEQCSAHVFANKA